MSDIKVTENTVECTIVLRYPYENDEQMVDGINNCKAAKDLLPKPEECEIIDPQGLAQ